MENNIYNQVKEVIENYDEFPKSDIFYHIHKRSYVFNEDVLKNNLDAKLFEVIMELPLPNYMKSKNALFNVPANVDLIKMLSDYLEFKCNNPTYFNQIQYHENQISRTKINGLAMTNFEILQNRF